MSPRSWLRSWLANHPRTATPRPRTRLAAEALEDRTVPTAVAVPSGLVSWWTANNTAADATGLNNATLTNVIYATGEVGKAFGFNGQNNWAALGDPASLAFTSSFSIEGWLKVNKPPTNNNFGSIMFRGDDRGGLDPYQLVIEPNGNLQFGISGTTGGAGIQAPITTGRWVHVAATLDGATGLMTLYENGAVVAQTTTTARPFGPLDPAQQPGVGIGNSNDPTSYNVPFNGLIDELSVYNRALTPGEVLGIFKAGTSGKVISPVSVDDPSVAEGVAGTTTSATFTLTRTGSLSNSLTVNWTTADDTATAGSDYVAASGAVTFAPGQTTQTVKVSVNGDNVPESNEVFKLIATPAGGTSVMGLATILNDDTEVSVDNAAATEGDGRIGQPMGAFVSRANNGGLNDAESMAWGPDGNLYAGSLATGQILKFNGTTGAYLGVFLDASKGLAPDAPFIQGLQFRPDGKLYVLSRNSSEVQRFDAATGAFIDTFIPSGSGGLNGAKGMTVGPDGNWYVSSGGTNQVMRYSGTTGAFLGVFVAAGSGGVSNPRALVFGPDNNLYVTSASTNSVLRYNGQTGAFIDAFVPSGSGGLAAPSELVFRNGSLYVGSQNTNEVLRYDAQTGAFLDKVASGGGLDQPIGLLFDSSGDLLVSSRGTVGGGEILRYGPRSMASFTVRLASTSAGTTTVDYTTADGTARAGTDYVATSGTLTFAPGVTSQTVLVPTLDDGLADPTRYFTLNLSNPTGGAVTRGQGIGTIVDDTKFYVVDGTGAKTDQYASSGTALANNPLGSGDTAPRGVATTAAGTTAWVVDANKIVYVYSTAGILLGSWFAGGLPVHAQLTGVTTNGTDVWLVDASADKVYTYAGAAGRTSGSQGASGSFALNRNDTNPTDLVTDGTSIWVVDDGASADKVYKYTLSGTLLGSWAIDPGNAHPTGITINPANVGDIWIVDNVSRRVYDYANAATRTSGSQSASATFALASGATDPQGIADPPAGAAIDPPPTIARHRHRRHAHHAAASVRWLSPEEFGWAPIDVTTHPAKRTRA